MAEIGTLEFARTEVKIAMVLQYRLALWDQAAAGLHALTRSLKASGFKPLNLSSDLLVSQSLLSNE
jgi:hypothetical protein